MEQFIPQEPVKSQRPSLIETSGFSKMVKNEDNDKQEMDAFFGSERNYVILTNSGKPVFAAKGDIYTLSSVYATLYAIVSKVQTYQFADPETIERKHGESQIFEADDMSFSTDRNESVYIRQDEKLQEQQQFKSWKMNNLMPFLNKQQNERLQLINKFQNTDEVGFEPDSPQTPENPYDRQCPELEMEEEKDPDMFYQQEMVNDNELKALITKFKKFKLCVMTVGGQGSEGCLIYIAMSKNVSESISHLRKQLQTLHLFLISAGTKSLITNLKNNFNYDILNDIRVRDQIPALTQYCGFVYQDPAAILNLYLPTRLHPMTRGAINNIILRHKPSKNPLEPQAENETPRAEETPQMNEEELEYLYYYGIVMMKNTVVTVFKNNPDIAVTPADINVLLNFTQNNTFQENEYFTEICLPGMTEEFRLPVFFSHFVQDEWKTDLKIILACEDQTPKIKKKLSEFCSNIFQDFVSENLIGFLSQSENSMYQTFSKYNHLKNKSIYNLDLPDTKCVLLANQNLDQYTHYNMPRDNCNPDQLYWIQQFEKLHNIYMRSKKKKEFCIKRVYEMDTYMLYSKGDIFIYAVIAHKGATREALEIGRQILSDAKEIESTSFIMKHV